MSQKNAPSLIGNAPKAAKPAPAPAKAAKPLEWFMVESSDKVIRMAGQAEFVIRQGKEINSGEYDIALLRSRGVKLAPIEPPTWWVQAQADGAAKHAALTEKGIDLPPLPETKAATAAQPS